MRTTKILLIAPALALGTPGLAAQASAQPVPAAESAPVMAEPVDPARLDVARAVVAQLFPVGTYARMMNGAMAQVADSAVSGMGQLPIAQIARAGGASEADVARLGPTTIAELASILDPAFKQRQHLIMQSVFASMGQLMGEYEPEIREGLSRAYARHFTAAQLADLKTFFATPTGGIYARDSMLLSADPEMVKAMQGVMPKLTAQMPAVMEQARKATASLPPLRRPEDLSPAERARLTALLGPALGNRKGK